MEYMNLGELYDYINIITNRDQLGEPADPVKFSILLKAHSINYYDINYKEILTQALAQHLPVSMRLFEETAFARFLVTKSFDYSNMENDVFAIPEDLKRTLDIEAHVKNIWRSCTITETSDFNARRLNVLAPSPERKPLAKKMPDGYRFAPNYIRKVRLHYLKRASIPYFDYCQGLYDDEIYYMPPGSYIKKMIVSGIEPGEEHGTDSATPSEPKAYYHLYDSDNNLIERNVFHPLSPTKFPHYSISVELDWDEEDSISISTTIIGALTTRSRELDVTQIATQQNT